MQPPMKTNSCDDFQTPKEALYPLIPYLKKDWVIWECASGKGNLVKGLKELGFDVISTDILSGADFLTWQPKHFDCIITNPPYSLKEKFLERCYQLGKPFALLLPLTTFETRKRQDLFKKYGVQVIFFDKRINFETPDGKGSGAWFATAWFTNWLNLEKDLVFVKLEHPKQKIIEEYEKDY
ncbi:MAG: tRNA (adenine-N(6)-)-methyltransferase [Thermoplasmata archaeon]|nr:MAG: tRNA (adenine-N(6)-)-methyltransferase [Thermoplasmata archaeon]